MNSCLDRESFGLLARMDFQHRWAEATHGAESLPRRTEGFPNLLRVVLTLLKVLLRFLRALLGLP